MSAPQADRSRRGQLGTILSVQVVSSAGFAAVLPFLPLYVGELGSHWGLAQELLAGLAYAAQSVTMMIAAPFWGRLADRYGRRRMVLRATACGALALTAMAFARSGEELVLLSALQGFLTGTVTAIAALVAASTPRNAAGRALATMQVGQWLGVALGPVAGGLIADQYGLRATFLVGGGMLLLSAMVVQFGIREPASVGGHPRPQGGTLANLRRVLTAKHLAGVYRLRFLDWFGRTIPIPFLPLAIAGLLLDEAATARGTGFAFAAAAFASIVSAVLLARYGESVGYVRVVIWSAVVASVAYLFHALALEFWQIVLLQAAAGAALGGSMPALSAMLSQASNPSDAGTVFGADGSLAAAARAAAPMFGALLVSWLGLQAVFVAAGAVYCVMAILMALSAVGGATPPVDDR